MKILSRVSIPQGSSNSFSEEYKENLIKKYSDACKSIEWHEGIGYLKIYTHIQKYKVLIEQLKRDNVYFHEYFKAEYSKNELDKAELLAITLKYQCEMTYNGDYDRHFEEYFKGCRFYTIQHSDLEILKRDLGKKDILISIENEYIVSPRLKNILDKENLTGLKYRPVYTKKHSELVAYQIIIENKLPLLNERTVLESVRKDNRYNFQRFVQNSQDPLFYSNESIRDAKDFNITSEYFGIGVFPRPVRIVSQRVRQIFLKNKIRGVEFEPVFILE